GDRLQCRVIRRADQQGPLHIEIGLAPDDIAVGAGGQNRNTRCRDVASVTARTQPKIVKQISLSNDSEVLLLREPFEKCKIVTSQPAIIVLKKNRRERGADAQTKYSGHERV